MMTLEPTASATTLAVCADCVSYLANGEVEDGMGHFITAEHAARMHAVWGEDFDISLGALGKQDEEDEDGFIEPWFSWQPCDGCGSALGGDREYATAWTEQS
jgi:hypothetical protein